MRYTLIKLGFWLIYLCTFGALGFKFYVKTFTKEETVDVEGWLVKYAAEFSETIKKTK